MIKRVALAAGLFAAAVSYGADCVWLGDKGDGLWSSAENWQGGIKPTSGNDDNVTISGSGAVDGEIRNDIGAISIKTLVFDGSEPFRLVGNALTFTGVSGVLKNTATVDVTNAVDCILTDSRENTIISSGTGTFSIEGVLSGEIGGLAIDSASSRRVRLAGANTFTGGLRQTGSGSGIILANPNAAGPDGATFKANGNIWFDAVGEYRCNITNLVTGNVIYYFLKHGTYDFYGDFSGRTTGTLNLYSYNPRVEGGEVNFRGEVRFPNAMIYPVMDYRFTTRFMKPLTLKTLTGGGAANDVFSILEFHATNNVGAVTPSHTGRIYTKVPDAFSGTTALMYDKYLTAGDGNAAGIFDLYGNSQHFDYVSHGTSKTIAGVIRSTGGPATLYLHGSASAATMAIVKDAVSIVWAPSDSTKTQTFSNRVSTTTGNITVSNGTFCVGKAAKFANVREISVGNGGVFRLDTTLASALAGAKKISVASGGSFVVASGATPLGNGTCSLKLGGTASFEIPADAAYRVANLIVDGTPVAAKTYTGDQSSPDYLPQLVGNGTVEVLSDSLSCVWTGGAGDGLWSSQGNWQDGAVPLTGASVSVSGGATAAIVNDIPGLALRSLEFAGSIPFRLSGEAISLTTTVSGAGLSCVATVPVTNALAIALPAGENTVVNGGSAAFVLEGGFSGSSAKLVLSSTGSGSFVLGGSNTHGGGTACTASGKLSVAGPASLPAGSTLEAFGDLTLAGGGTYGCDICWTSTSGNLYLGSPAAYDFNGRLWSDTHTGVLRIRNTGGGSADINFNDTLQFPSANLDMGVASARKVMFNKPVRFKTLHGNESYTDLGCQSHFYDTNTVTTVSPCLSMYPVLHIANAFPTVPRIYFDRYTSGGSTIGSGSGLLDMLGHDQTFDRIEHKAAQATSDYWTGRGAIRSTQGGAGAGTGSTDAVLTLRGTGSASTSAAIMNGVTVVWNPVNSEYVQTFCNRASTTTGDLIVSNGVMEVSGTATFANVKRIVVAAGATFRLNVTVANALQSVTSIEIAPGGTFQVLSGETPFAAGSVLLDYSTGAAFKMPSGASYDLYGLRVDGEAWAGDTYDSTSLPGLEGGTLVARDLPVVRVDATWNGGAAPDESIAAAANWVGGSCPPLSGGALVAKFANGGSRATVGADVDIMGMAFTGSSREFTVAGPGCVTVRGEGVAVGGECTNVVVSAPLCAHGDQEWSVASGARLDIDGGISGRYGDDAIHKTGAGALWLNSQSGAIGPFTLGSRSESGGTVYVNVATNAFGTASDEHGVRICAVTGNGMGRAQFVTSTVVERPFTFDSENSYYVFWVDDNVDVRFTKKVTTTGATRLRFGGNVNIICEGGAKLGGWLCLDGATTAKWIFRNGSIEADYLYMPRGPSIQIETTGNTIRGIDIFGQTTLNVTVPFGLDTTGMRVLMRSPLAKLQVSGDQNIGGFLEMSGGTITSDVASKVTFSQYNWSYVLNPTEKPITNSAVKIEGAVTLYKTGASLFVQDCAADTTGGIGVGEGVLRLTENARFRKATEFLVKGTSRAEVEGRRTFGSNVRVDMDSTATLALANDERVAALYIDGTRMPEGSYGPVGSGADHELGCFEGPGLLNVGKHGALLIFH